MMRCSHNCCFGIQKHKKPIPNIKPDETFRIIVDGLDGIKFPAEKGFNVPFVNTVMGTFGVTAYSNLMWLIGIDLRISMMAIMNVMDVSWV